MANAKKWMQGVHPKKGALHRELGIPMGERIPVSELHKVAGSKGKLGARARLALAYHKAKK